MAALHLGSSPAKNLQTLAWPNTYVCIAYVRNRLLFILNAWSASRDFPRFSSSHLTSMAYF